MLNTCKKCGETKEFNSSNFRVNKVKGKLYLEKVCKRCRHVAAQKRRKERYHSEPEFRKKILSCSEKSRKWNQENKTLVWKKRLETLRKWQESNRGHIRQKEKDRHKKRWSDPVYRLSKNLSNYINKCIRDKKFDHCFELLNYSLQDLINHIQSQFQEGMTWENYGKWHIDHIKPVCSFNFSSKQDPQFKECWSLSNLRPLWAKDNLKKSSLDKVLKNQSL